MVTTWLSALKITVNFLKTDCNTGILRQYCDCTICLLGFNRGTTPRRMTKFSWDFLWDMYVNQAVLGLLIQIYRKIPPWRSLLILCALNGQYLTRIEFIVHCKNSTLLWTIWLKLSQLSLTISHSTWFFHSAVISHLLLRIMYLGVLVAPLLFSRMVQWSLLQIGESYTPDCDIHICLYVSNQAVNSPAYWY